MYYRDNSGCLGVLVIAIILMVVFGLLFNPYFWLVAGVLFLYSAVRRALLKAKYGDREEEYDTYTYSQSSGGNPSAPYDVDEYTEGTDDPNLIEQAYETDAIDVDVEVTTDRD